MSGSEYTEQERDLLRKELKKTITTQIVFITSISIMMGVAIGNYVFAWWTDTVTVLLVMFSLLLFFGWMVAFKNAMNLKRDLNEKGKRLVSGVVKYKKIAQGTTVYFFDREYVEQIAAYQEDQKAGISKDYGNNQSSLVLHAGLDFYIRLTNEETYTIGAANYLLIEDGDTVVMETAPRSKIVFRFAKA